MNIQNHLMALGLAGAMALGTAVSASAGPLPIGNSALTTATAPATTEIQYRGHRGYAAIAASVRVWRSAWPPARWSARRSRRSLMATTVMDRYAPGYVYDEPVYAQPYAYEPVYPAPGYYGVRVWLRRLHHRRRLRAPPGLQRAIASASEVLGRRAESPPLFYVTNAIATGIVAAASIVSRVRICAISGASPPSWRARM